MVVVVVVGTKEVEDEALVAAAVRGWADEICVKVAVGTAVVEGLLGMVGVTEVVVAVVPDGVVAVGSHPRVATLARAGGKLPCYPASLLFPFIPSFLIFSRL